MTGTVSRVRRMRTAGLPFTDPFSRSNGPVEDTSHPWYTPVGSNGSILLIASNTLRVDYAGAFQDAFLDTGSTVVDLTVDVTLGAANTQIFLLRNPPTLTPETANLYLLAWSAAGGTLNLLHRTATGDTICTSITGLTTGSTHTLRARVSSSDITVFVDGGYRYTEPRRFTPTATQTCIALTADDTTSRFDNVSITTPVGAVFTDDFNRTNGAPSNGWSTWYGSVIPIISNRLDSSGTSSGGIARDFGSKDFDLTFDYTYTTSNNLFSSFRQTAAADTSLFYFQANGAAGTFTIWQRDRPVAGGSLTDVVVYSGSGPSSVNGTWRIVCTGTSFKAYLGGSLVCSTTLPADKSNQGTYYGVDALRPASSGITIDNVLVIT